MLVTVWIETNNVGSRCEDQIEIPDEELEGLTGAEREDAIAAACRDVIWNMAEWGWSESEPHDA
jgi:hypothetical protein